MSRTLVIGAGPAGVSAAIWLAELGAPFDWIEAGDRIGGTLHRVHNPIANDLGPTFDSGAALAHAMAAQIREKGLEPRFGARATALRATTPTAPVEVDIEGTTRTYGAVILATGAERKTLGLDGERAHLGRGVAVSGRKERRRFSGKRVAIIGGGDAAFENALLLVEVGAKVTLVHRGADFQARAEFVEPALTHPGITILAQTTLEAIEGQKGAPFLDAVRLKGPEGPLTLPTEGLLVRIGEQANLPGIDVPGLERVDGGFLKIGREGHAGHPRILAAGDCACPDFRAVVVAAGQGAQAARTAAVMTGL